ncbi:MAG: FtsX-like permease family protein [Acidobacteriota bacterium]
MIRNLLWFWRTNLAVVAGVAVAVAVLVGAQMVGESVQASLRALALGRLGRVDGAVVAALPFTEGLAERLAVKGRVMAPVLHFTGIVKHQESSRSASKVLIYGVDERYWKLQGMAPEALGEREAVVSEALAREFGAKAGDGVLVRIEKPSEIPQESLHGRREGSVRTVRFRVKKTAPGGLALEPQQGELRVVYVALSTLQKELEQAGRANVLLVQGPLVTEAELRDGLRMEDLGLKLRPVEGGMQLESGAGLLREDQVARINETAGKLGLRAEPLLTYLANFMRVGGREVPYSLVTATPEVSEGVKLSAWTERELGAKPGDRLEMEYYVWRAEGKLDTARETFAVAGRTALGDRAMAPDYPGISDADTVADWDPPFPMDLNKIRPVDEKYWEQYRTTPKAFVSLAEGQRLWGTRFGKVSGVRLYPAGKEQAWIAAFLPSVDLARDGLTLLPVRAQALAASAGSTDFGMYFGMFSGFVMIAAFVLTALFFRLGIEQRLREIGLYLAVGYTRGEVRRIFVREGLVLGLVGTAVGCAGAWVYAGGLLYGLRTWWNEAVGTQALALHFSWGALRGAVVPGVVVSVLVVMITLRRLRGLSPWELLAGRQLDDLPRRTGRLRWMAAGFLGAGLVLAGAAAAGRVPAEGGFFGAGFLLLVGGTLGSRAWLEAGNGGDFDSLGRLAWANAGQRPGRSMMTVALIALATFLLIALEAFRHPPAGAVAFGRYRYIAESQSPLYEKLDGALMLRVRPGEDASCLNLYAPGRPKVVGLPEGLVPALDKPLADGAVPAAADANSLQYILHKAVGEEMTLDGGVRIRFVATVPGSVLQSEVMVGEKAFLRAFPGEQGFRMMMFEKEPAAGLEEQFSDAGLDVMTVSEKLAQYLRVEHAYLSTFQALGALGLVLGTLGLGAVLLRNVMERRRELALLRAVGFTGREVAQVIVLENVLLLGLGLGVGVGCALLAVAPALVDRGQAPPVGGMAGLVAAVFVTGLAASVGATRAALRTPLLEALRSE